ncbi:MAG TPA: O-antigen ligase family protein [Pyrinomonadaceae bacterium]|nr:O-antigen ligase family protein [Pyrinomonadaceae bacterium]
MSQAAPLEFQSVQETRSQLRFRVASILGGTVFLSLLSLIVLTAIPYGTSQPWWIAAFAAAVFALAILWLVEGYLSQSWFGGTLPLVFPLAALAVFALFQTFTFIKPISNPAGIRFPMWNAISADPYQTRLFVLWIMALTLAGVMLARHAGTEKRLRIVINVIVCVAVASAIFGILRQTTQHEAGFGLPLLSQGSGYGQFINYNHFAYLMEMAFGLILGLVLAGGVKREQGLIYFAALLPLWTGLVLCGSRGGLIAMMAQVLVAALLFSGGVRKGNVSESHSRVLDIARSVPVRVTLIVVLVLGVAIGTLWLGGDQLAMRIEQSRNELNADTTNARLGVSRNEIWKATWKMFRAHPVLGVGMNGYWAAIPKFHDASGTMMPQEAHNDYLELLASGGLVGIAIFVWFVVVVLKRTRANLASPSRFRRAASYGATIGITGVAVHSLLDFGLHTIVNALVFTTLIVIATSKPRWENGSHRIA